MEGLIPTKDAAELIGVKPGTLQDKAEKQQIAHYKMGNRLYFKKEDLEKFVESHRVEARPTLRRLRRAHNGKISISAGAQGTVHHADLEGSP